MEGTRAPEILRRITVYCIYLAAFLAPLFYLPITIDPLFAKQSLIIILVAVALLAWLIRVLVQKEIRYGINLLNIAYALLFALLFLSSVFSVHGAQSFFAPDQTGERFFSFAAFLILAFLIAGSFSREEVEKMVIVLFASATLFSALIFLQITPLVTLPGPLGVNPAGTLNGASLLLGGFLFMALSFFVFRPQEIKYSRFFLILVRAFLILAAVNLLLINFKIGWVGISATAALLAALMLSRFSFQAASSIALFAILGVSLMLAILPLSAEQFIPGLRTELEVAPSLLSTLAIDFKVLKTLPVLGSGPGTFVYDYNLFRPPAFNQTIFWNSPFNRGFSSISTAVATLGTLGVAALLFFIAAVFILLWRTTRNFSEDDPLLFGFTAFIVFGLILWFIYPSTFAMNFMIFLSLGSLVALERPVSESGESFWKKSSERIFKIENQMQAFVSSLAITAVFIFVILSGYIVIQKYVAEAYFTSGIVVLNKYGNTDTALVRFARSLAFDPQNDRYLASQSRVYLSRTQQSIARINAGDTTAQSDFQINLNSALDSARRATLANPRDPLNWLALGTIYETVLPFIDGADRFAVTFYAEAALRDPISPVPPTFTGRTALSVADILSLRAQQGVIPPKDANPAVAAALNLAKESLEKAVSLKSDYATAQFLLAQTFSRQGNIDEAIRRSANAAIVAPQDIGIAFFLGFLLYQKNQLVDAEVQFSRAVELNPNYSNARYFLGLIYDRTNREGEALKQFKNIAELNPDNDEVKKIIANLEAGRPALAAITPPPEKRKEPPVKETERQKTRMRR